MKTIVQAWNALLAEPLAIVMAVIALVCAIPAVSFGIRGRDRVLLAGLSVLSGISAWLMASHFRFR
jgi:hypothetical protein